MKKQPTQKKIIIVGAGIAGLAACTRLMENGFDAQILEARDRIGGRITSNNKLGIPFDSGAAWIHGIENNPIAQIAKTANAEMVITDPNKFAIFDRNGSPIPENIIAEFYRNFGLLLKKAKELAFSLKHDVSLSDALSHFIKLDSLSPIEEDLLKNRLFSWESYLGAGYELLSARNWDQEETWPGENCFLTSSYQPIIDTLAKKCPIQLNTIVNTINMRSKDVEIVTDTSVYYADAVIITVPLGVLKKNAIIFNPPLPTDKQDAIQRSEMGLFNITALKFAEPFWPNENQLMFCTQFDSLSIPVFLNLHHFIKEPILVGYSGGETAKQLETLTDSQIIEKTMNNFSKMFGGIKLPQPEAYINTRWSTDPYSYGSYTYIPVGSSISDHDVIAEPVSNQIFFAGEATSSKHPATTHGAYITGLREADRIINSAAKENYVKLTQENLRFM